MSALMFFYTLAIITVCLVTAVLSASAYVSSHRRLFAYGAGAFICYAAEIIEIFFYEYTSQNQVFPASEYYDITMPVIRTVVATAAQAFIWLIALDLLDKHSKKLFWIPVAVFAAAEALVLVCFPVTAFRQWLYYTLRQVFMFFVLAYAFYAYKTSLGAEYRMRIAQRRQYFIVAAVLVVCILVEDTFNILIMPMTSTPDWFMLYISERNFSENIFACYMAFVLVRYALDVLAVRIEVAPQPEKVENLDRHVDDHLPFFAKKYQLSPRETEVLRLLVLGRSNQQIADELILAVGTVKTHVHNIMVKTGQENRTALILHFWQG